MIKQRDLKSPIWQIAPDQLEKAYGWLRKRRAHFPASCPDWHFFGQWAEIKADLKASIQAGTYRFSPLNVYLKQNQHHFVWRPQDALVQKVMADQLEMALAGTLSKQCVHLKGHGGHKASVQTVQKQMKTASFFYRSDIASFYQSIDHKILMRQLKGHVKNPVLLTLIWRFLRHTVHYGGCFADNTQGIPTGSPLSPLLGALYLSPLDEAMAETGLFYQRFMDDYVMFSDKRWPLKRAIQKHYRVLKALKLDIRPEKTQVGRVAKGLTWLGYHLTPHRLTVSQKTQTTFLQQIHRLFEQGHLLIECLNRVKRWLTWAIAGLNSVELNIVIAELLSLFRQAGRGVLGGGLCRGFKLKDELVVVILAFR